MADALSARFSCDALGANQRDVVGYLNGEGLSFAELLDELLPDCREKDLAIERIEEAVMWSRLAVERGG